MSKKQFKIKPKAWPKEYTFEEFKRLNPNINESVLINYYNKYLQEYAENRSRFLNYFNDNKKLLSSNLTEIKNRYDDSQYFLRMYHYNQADAVGGSNPISIFQPTDIKGLTHWFKVEPRYIQSQNYPYNATTNVQEIVSWSSAIGDSHLVKHLTSNSGYYITPPESSSFVTIFRGRTYLNGNTGGQRMKLTDNPRFGAFTYFAVFELNHYATQINYRDNVHNISSITYFEAGLGTEKTIGIQQSTNVRENYRLVFRNNAIDEEEIILLAANNFSEQAVVVNFEPFMSDNEKAEGKISGSTLASATNAAINTLPFYTSSHSGRLVTFYKYPATSSITHLPSDGNFNNARGESQTLVLTSGFEGEIVQSAQQENSYHGIWAGQDGNGSLDHIDNSMLLFGRPIAITGSMRQFFSFSASSSLDTGDSTGTIEAISNDPEHNKKFVFMVTKDAHENAVLKVYVNNVSVFPEGSEAAGNLELDDPAHFEPKFFGKYNGQERVLNGKVYEMGFYTGSLSETDRTQLYYYLGLKHNTHNYDGSDTLEVYNYSGKGYLP